MDCCKTCKFYKTKIDSAEGPYRGRCHRYPPVPFKKILLAEFPVVSESSWCGEYNQTVETDAIRQQYHKPPGVYINEHPVKVGEYVIRPL